MDIGSAVGRKDGISDQQILELADFETSPAFSELEKLVLRYATLMTETPVEVHDAGDVASRRQSAGLQLSRKDG